ncbi:MAG: hypothetical protein ABUT20_29775, partial [Bacteroidota bacterium]
MDYRNLPIEERISKAAEYCLLLADDERADVNIVSEVKTTFFLTDEQAQEAYALMKQKYNSEYKKTLGRKIKLAWIVLFVLVVCVAFYAILGDELGSFFYLLAAFFALSIIGIFFSLGNLYFKKSTLLQNLFSNTGNSSSDKKESK